MSTPLEMLARATDTKGYPDDKNPDHWRKIKGAPVHLDANGNIDGGAGGKFGGKKWTSAKHPHKPASYSKPGVTTADLKKAWSRVAKYHVAMQRAKTTQLKLTHAQNMLSAIEDYQKLKQQADPSVQNTHKPDIKKAQQHAQNTINAPAGQPLTASQFIGQYQKLQKAVQNGDRRKIQSLLKDVSQNNYDKFTLQEKKQIWKAAGSKANYLNTVQAANSAVGQQSGALQNLAKVGAGTSRNPFPVQQTQAKVAANPQDADNTLRPVLQNVWSKASAAEKNAAFTYSYSYKQFQEPLRGGTWGYGGGTGIPLHRMNWSRIGVGTMGKKPGEVKNLIKNLTSIIDKSSYNQPVQLERGTGLDGLAVMFGVSIRDLQSASAATLNAKMVKRVGKDEAFTSCGSSAGAGFSNFPAVMHIDCPPGTKMLYMEPFAAYGGDAPYNAASMYGTGRTPHQYWDGKSKQKKFGDQDETLLQRGTTYECTKVERKNGQLHVYVQVKSQDPFPIP